MPGLGSGACPLFSRCLYGLGLVSGVKLLPKTESTVLSPQHSPAPTYTHTGIQGPVRVRGPHPGCPLTPLSPQRSDPQLLAQFYHADEELSQVAAELDSLDGRKDPQRCTLLVSQFRSCQVRGGDSGGGRRGAELGTGRAAEEGWAHGPPPGECGGWRACRGLPQSWRVATSPLQGPD